MSFPKGSVVVLEIAGDRATVFCDDPQKESLLLRLGFSRDKGFLNRPIKDDSDRKQLVRALIEQDALFSRGKEWSPAELLEYYAEQGLSLPGYRVIAWSSPASYEITSQG